VVTKEKAECTSSFETPAFSSSKNSCPGSSISIIGLLSSSS